MKKFMFILTIALLGGISKSEAQSTLVATLTHGDEITMFYGVDAFVKAHNAAVDGDIINLSGGKFNSTTITKGITIRGTGVEVANPTYIINGVNINVPTTATERLSIEGCRFVDRVTANSISNAYFLKNQFQNGFYLNGNVTNTIFVNCTLDGRTHNDKGLYSYPNSSNSSNSSAQFINCRINQVIFDAGVFTFINCVIIPHSGFEARYLSNSSLVNSILYYTSTNSNGGWHTLPATSSAWNCVAIGANASNVFDNLSSPQNCWHATKDIFIDGIYTNDLTDEAKATYLGNDGTPVGRYGGPFPWSMTPTYPQITKMNVANRTTADGKLSVEIEVSATE